MLFSEIKLRAFTVCVNYDDLLNLSALYNQHHFDEWIIITSLSDYATREIARCRGLSIHSTDIFYANHAVFNKWAAVEQALDVYGRHGWIVMFDSDVFWPKVIPDFECEIGKLYSPVRRMIPSLPKGQLIPENIWRKFPIHRNIAEWAGYSQIFHGDDPHLPPPPWHNTKWIHAGGADSFFQRRWPTSHKVRPPFECLHVGEPGVNWYGRCTDRLDGKPLPDGQHERRARVMDMWRKRRATKSFDGEFIDPS